MSSKHGPQRQSSAGHNGEVICPTCDRPLRDTQLGGVTEDTVSFCVGTGMKACLEWKHRNETAPGEPEPTGLFGWKQSTWASIREVARIAIPVAGAAALLAASDRPKRRKKK